MGNALCNRKGTESVLEMIFPRLAPADLMPGPGAGAGGEQAVTAGVPLHSVNAFMKQKGGQKKQGREKKTPANSPLSSLSSVAPGGIELHNTMGFNKMPLTHKVCLLPAS